VGVLGILDRRGHHLNRLEGRPGAPL
jgi:hypothetical protein